MILDLTTPFHKMSFCKDPSQREAWEYFDYSIILPDCSQESSWRECFPRGKEN